MKNFYFIFIALLAVCGLAKAQTTFTAGVDATTSDDDRTFTKGDITLTITDGKLNTQQYRVYKSQTLTITSAGKKIKAIKFTCSANGTDRYGPGSFDAQDGYTFESDGKIGMWQGESASVSFTAGSNQVRVTEIVVAVEGETIDGDVPGPGPAPQLSDIDWTSSATAPLTVAAVLEKAAKLETGASSDKEVYVKGRISQIKYTFDAKYGTATFYISDNGQTEGEILCYYTYYLGNRTWADGDDQINVGDEVIVCGIVTNYNGTLEMANRKNYLYSLNGKTAGGDSMGQYKVTYMVDGEVYKTVRYDFEAAVTPEEAPEKEGYTFSGWSEVPETMPAHDVTVTGSFTINSYTIIYMVDGEEYKRASVEYGTELVAEENPEKEGYTFSGWSEVPPTMPAHDVNVTGSFTVNIYSLIYMVDGKAYKTTSVMYGTKLNAETAPTKEGYTFSGWSEIPETMPARDVIITGTFTVNNYIITYIVDGDIYYTDVVKYGTPITPIDMLEREGYTFSWSEMPATMPAHDVTVTGSFVINQYSVTYIYEGEVFKVETYDYLSEVVAPAFPLVVEGYTFVWDGLPERMPAHDVTVTGVFQVNQYSITYVVDGEVVDTQLVDYGSEITPPAVADKEGYTFGWDAYPPTMPAHDLTITGSYLTGIRSLRGGLAVQQIYTVDGKRVTKVGRGVHLVRQGKQIIKIVK